MIAKVAGRHNDDLWWTGGKNLTAARRRKGRTWGRGFHMGALLTKVWGVGFHWNQMLRE